jgi:hypothetical protein
MASARLWTDPLSIKNSGYEDPSITPAQNLVNNLNQLLAVSSFDQLVAQNSPLYSQLPAVRAAPQGWPAADLHAHLKAQAYGTNLVTISYSGKTAAIAMEVLHSVLQLAPKEMQAFNRRPVTGGVMRVVDLPALSPGALSKKSLLLELGLAFAFGLLFSAAFIVTRTALDRSVRYPDEVPEVVGLPVLGVVPFSRDLSKREGAR